MGTMVSREMRGTLAREMRAAKARGPQCPYCAQRVYAEQPKQTRGEWVVHALCQIQRERTAAYYLGTDGRMV
jgi:hypothetical protein